MVRLSETVDEHIDQLTRDILAIRLAMQDGVVTGDERADIEHRLELSRRQLDAIASDVMVIGDAHKVAQTVLNAGGVSPWVVRQTREKGADYLRLVEAPHKARVVTMPSRGERSNVVPFSARRDDLDAS